MKITLLKGGQVPQPSPVRAVYSLEKDSQGNYIFIVPVDIWLLQLVRGGSGQEELRNSAFFSRPLDGMKIGSPGAAEGFATLFGSPPSVLIPGTISPFFKCLESTKFIVSTREEKEVEEISGRDILLKDEVKTGLELSTTRGNAAVTHTDVAFSYDFLGLPITTSNTYQIELTGRASNRIIGSPVETKAENGQPPKLVGMLIGLEKQSNNKYKGWVFPAEDIN